MSFSGDFGAVYAVVASREHPRRAQICETGPPETSRKSSLKPSTDGRGRNAPPAGGWRGQQQQRTQPQWQRRCPEHRPRSRSEAAAPQQRQQQRSSSSSSPQAKGRNHKDVRPSKSEALLKPERGSMRVGRSPRRRLHVAAGGSPSLRAPRRRRDRASTGRTTPFPGPRARRRGRWRLGYGVPGVTGVHPAAAGRT